MEFKLARLRSGEYIVGASGLVLLASMFLPWYGLKSRLVPTAAQLDVSTSVTGWDALSHVRWLLLLASLVAFALVFSQASRRAPAIPVSFSVIATVLGILSLLALIYRVLINLPGASPLDRKPGAFIGLLGALAMTYGGYRSMRGEGVATRDEPREIETVRLPSVGES